jgi:hypothetical protein
MRCSEFLRRYSDFRDETIEDPMVRRRFVAHVSLCGRCARYQEVIDLGVSLLRAAHQIDVSPRFHTRLARRLAAVLRPEPVFAVPVRTSRALVTLTSLSDPSWRHTLTSQSQHR